MLPLTTTTVLGDATCARCEEENQVCFQFPVALGAFNICTDCLKKASDALSDFQREQDRKAGKT